MTTWTTPTPPTVRSWNAQAAASTAWFDKPLDIPEIWDGGLARQVSAYFDQVSGSSTVALTSFDAVSGAAPFTVTWTPRGAPA